MTVVDATFELFDEAPVRGVFSASSRMTVLDHFRIPYEIDPGLGGYDIEQLRPYRAVPRCTGSATWMERLSRRPSGVPIVRRRSRCLLGCSATR